CHTLVEELRVSRPEITVDLQGATQALGHFDGTRLGQAFSNLIANAVHHGDLSKPITVTLTQGPAAVEFSVHNWASPFHPPYCPICSTHKVDIPV
ncbi:unnamed protein product, partial [marine sediment metagenome]